MQNSDAINDKILDGWEKSETEKKVPYYVNHRMQRTQWDHPLMVKTMEELVSMDDIRYAAYRTAKKLRFLQRRLHLDLVSLNTLSGAFDRHQGRGTDGKISCIRLYSLLLDIFTLVRTDAKRHKHNPEQMAELALNWILNLFDVGRSGSVKLRAAKVALITLCNARLKEKYNYFFHLLCSADTHSLNQANLASLLEDMIQLPEIMSESSSFGGLNVGPAVESCFKGSYSHSGVSQDVFMVWMLREPQTLVWLPTLHRLTAAETVQHDAKCNVCKSYPIIGLRYKCLKCFNFDICQNCFFTGKSSKKHKLKHPTEEYCFAPSSKEGTKAFMKIIRNNLSKKHCNKFKPRYLPISGGEADQPFRAQPSAGPSDSYGKVQPVASHSRDENDAPGAARLVSAMKQPPPADAHTQTTPAGPSVRGKGIGSQEQRQLESIIVHLESENRDLLDEIERLTALSHSYSEASERSEAERRQEEQARLAAKHDVLETYNRQLEAQLSKLRHLLNQDTPPPVRPSPISTSQREPLSLLSQNTPELHPYQESPPPYLTQPEFRPKFLSKQGYSSSTPHYGNTPRALTIPDNDLTIDNTTNGLLADLTYGSLDGTMARTHMSLNSSGGGSRNYLAEEAELANLLKKLDLAFPGDVTMSQTVNYSSHDNLKAVYEAAHQIGDAMSDFVGHIGQPEDQSMFDLAEELIASRASKMYGDQEAPSREDEDDSDFEEEDTINGPSLIYSMIDHEDHTPWGQIDDDHMYPEDSPYKSHHGTPLNLRGVSHTYVDYSC